MNPEKSTLFFGFYAYLRVPAEDGQFRLAFGQFLL